WASRGSRLRIAAWARRSRSTGFPPSVSDGVGVYRGRGKAGWSSCCGLPHSWRQIATCFLPTSMRAWPSPPPRWVCSWQSATKRENRRGGGLVLEADEKPARGPGDPRVPGESPGRAALIRGPPVEQRIEAPRTGTCHPQIKKREADQDRKVTAVEDGQPGPREMRFEERNRHIAAQDEGNRAAEQPDSQQTSADELDHSLDAQQ